MTQLLTAAVSLALASVSLADVTYQYDDGTGGNAGPIGVGTFVWGNVFEVQDGASEITAVLVALGRVPAGATVTAMVFEDPSDDGNPDDAVLLTAVDFVPSITQSNTYTQIDITPTRVVGKFYVACATHIDGTINTNAARTDPQSRDFGGNTFLYWGADLNPLTLTGWSNRAQYAGLATVMVRAIGRVPVIPPACPADLGTAGGLRGQDGLLNNNDFIAFIDLFFAQDPAADVGTAGGLPGSDGAWNNNDFIAFINLFFNGCG